MTLNKYLKEGIKLMMARCIDCQRLSIKKMKCFPGSKDAPRKSYNLTKEDLYKNARCDFFVRKKVDHSLKKKNR